MFAEYESDFDFSFFLVILIFPFIDRFKKLSENALTCRIDDLDPVQYLVLVPVSQ